MASGFGCMGRSDLAKRVGAKREVHYLNHPRLPTGPFMMSSTAIDVRKRESQRDVNLE